VASSARAACQADQWPMKFAYTLISATKNTESRHHRHMGTANSAHTAIATRWKRRTVLRGDAAFLHLPHRNVARQVRQEVLNAARGQRVRRAGAPALRALQALRRPLGPRTLQR
jgi:hypothetical protein